jgi:hypothetical protein
LTVDDALSYVVAALRAGKALGQSGYDVFTSKVIDDFLIERERLSRDTRGNGFRDRGIAISPLFSSALWELCRRGIIRPGVRELGEGGVGGNVFGEGYALTPFGREWLQRAEYEQIASIIPGRFVELLSAHQRRFGPGFLSRGREAIQCYTAQAFLACCAMCGAAAESVILAIAIEQKSADEVLRMYSSSGGRSRIENLLIGQAPDRVKTEFRGFLQLLAYWRDDAAHGRRSDISEVEAFTSLMLLLRLARYADEGFPAGQAAQRK